MALAAPITTWTAGEARAALAVAPAATLDALCPAGAILVVAPHPDDETLGCGGLIALAAAAGRAVHVAILTDGAASHPGSVRAPPPRLARLRRREARDAVRRLSAGRASLHLFGAPDGDLRAHEAAAAAWLRDLALHTGVGSVFTTWEADPHLDHKAASAVAAATAEASGAALRSYPVWGLTLADDAPAGPRRGSARLDISAVLALKRAAAAAHRTQTTALIPDTPDAFRLRPEDLARHLQPSEPYLLL